MPKIYLWQKEIPELEKEKKSAHQKQQKGSQQKQKDLMLLQKRGDIKAKESLNKRPQFFFYSDLIFPISSAFSAISFGEKLVRSIFSRLRIISPIIILLALKASPFFKNFIGGGSC